MYSILPMLEAILLKKLVCHGTPYSLQKFVMGLADFEINTTRVEITPLNWDIETRNL